MLRPNKEVLISYLRTCLGRPHDVSKGRPQGVGSGRTMVLHTSLALYSNKSWEIQMHVNRKSYYNKMILNGVEIKSRKEGNY